MEKSTSTDEPPTFAEHTVAEPLVAARMTTRTPDQRKPSRRARDIMVANAIADQEDNEVENAFCNAVGLQSRDEGVTSRKMEDCDRR